jgi:hypothetical protein
MQRQTLFCLTWIALIPCALPGGERGSSANGKAPRCRRSSEIDFVAVLVQQLYVIGVSLENSRRKYFGEKGIFSRQQGSTCQASVNAKLLVPLPVRRRASTIRSPIRARGASDTTKGQDEDRFGISRSCSVVISICRTIAANGRALPTSFAVQ